MKNKILKTTCFIGLLIPMTSISFGQIANTYPHDSLIQTDPSVVFTEMFEDTSISSMISSGGYVPPSSAAIPNFSFASSVPIGSLGTQSGKFTTYQTVQSTTSVGYNIKASCYCKTPTNNYKIKAIIPQFLEEARKDKTFSNVDANLKFNKPEIELSLDIRQDEDNDQNSNEIP